MHVCACAGWAIFLSVLLAANTLAETLLDNHYWFAARRLELRAKVNPQLSCLAAFCITSPDHTSCLSFASRMPVLKHMQLSSMEAV